MKHQMKHIHTLSCADVYEHLCDNLDEQLESEKCREIKAHIMECENCTALLHSLKKTISFYRNYPTPALSRQARSELFSVIHADIQKSKKKNIR
jgi:hypothetical protein